MTSNSQVPGRLTPDGAKCPSKAKERFGRIAQTANYSSWSNTSLVSPPLNLESPAALVFESRYELEQGDDFVLIEAQTEQGWQTLSRLAGESDWCRTVVELPQETRRVRFRLTSDLFGNRDGFYLNRVKIFAHPEDHSSLT